MYGTCSTSACTGGRSPSYLSLSERAGEDCSSEIDGIKREGERERAREEKEGEREPEREPERGERERQRNRERERERR